jgi:hypothetical protein
MVTATKVKAPSFYGRQASTPTKSSGDSKPLILAMLVVVGVAFIFIMRNRNKATTGPVLTVVPSNETDASAIANLTQSANGLARAAGGTSSPLVTSPNS